MPVDGQEGLAVPSPAPQAIGSVEPRDADASQNVGNKDAGEVPVQACGYPSVSQDALVEQPCIVVCHLTSGKCNHQAGGAGEADRVLESSKAPFEGCSLCLAHWVSDVIEMAPTDPLMSHALADLGGQFDSLSEEGLSHRIDRILDLV